MVKIVNGQHEVKLFPKMRYDVVRLLAMVGTGHVEYSPIDDDLVKTAPELIASYKKAASKFGYNVTVFESPAGEKTVIFKEIM